MILSIVVIIIIVSLVDTTLSRDRRPQLSYEHLL